MVEVIASDLQRQGEHMTERFLLRPLRPSDAGLIAHYTADRRVAEGTRSIPHPLPPGAAEAYVRRALSTDRDEDVWAIDGSANRLAELLGVVSLTRMEADQSELGFWVGAGFWNTGFATEAVAATHTAASMDEAWSLVSDMTLGKLADVFAKGLERYWLRWHPGYASP